MEEEMRLHVEMQAEENSAAGMRDDEARYAARRRFGNAALLKEASGDAWGWRPLERLFQDLHYAARVLRRSPILTVSAVLTLALGIGANTAVFSVIDAVLIHPYPYPEYERIMAVEAWHARSDSGGSSYRDFLDWREQNSVFEDMAIVPWTYQYTLTGKGEPQRLLAGSTTPGFLRVLGVQPLLGRFFTEDEDRPDGARVLLLSYPMWQQHFGGRTDILGQTVTLNGKPHTIIGVLPGYFTFPGIYHCEIWVPLRENPGNSRNQHQYGAMARLKRGITVARAQAEMATIAGRLEKRFPETNKGWNVIVMPMSQAMAPEIRTGLLILYAAVAFVLLLVCANVAALFLARASGRGREIAIRASLGAGRLRIIRQLLTESTLLSLLGGVLGLGVAQWLIGLMIQAGPPEFWLETALRLDGRMLCFTFAVSVLCGIVFGLAPAVYGSRTDLAGVLKGHPGGGSGAHSRNRMLSVLVAGEVALSLVLLTASTLLAKDYLHMFRLDLGIRTENILTFALSLPSESYTPERASAFYRELLPRLSGLPGVDSAAAVGSLPLGGQYYGTKFEIEGRPKPADRMEMSAQTNVATPGYFETMGIPLLRGRAFTENDTAHSLPVTVIDETFARRHFPDQDPIGHRLKTPDMETIVGVVGAVRHNGPAWRKEASPLMYFPREQASSRNMTLVLRTTDQPENMAPAVRGVIRSLDPQLPILSLRTMRKVLFDKLMNQLLMDSLMGGFACFALLLTAIGVYGIIAYSVSQRRQEMGVRIALGATRSEILVLVIRRCLLLVLAGVAVGLPLAIAAGRLLSSLLFGVSPADITVFAAAPALLLIVALCASYMPARTATRIDPVTALRSE